MKRKIRLRPVLALAILVGWFQGCTKDPGWNDRQQDADYTTLVLKMRVSAGDTPYTRAITAQDETHVEELDVLVFSVQGDQERYLYHAVPEAGWTSASGSFSVKLRNREHLNDYHRIVLVANLHERIVQLKSSFQSGVTTKAEVFDRITFATATPWNAAGSDDFTPIPMWGELSDPVTVSPATSSLGAVTLLRALARVNVGVNFQLVGENLYQAQGLASGGAPEPFMLTGIKVYHARNMGHAAPLAAVCDNYIVSAPTIPQAAVAAPPLTYVYTTPGGVLSSMNEIYIPESDNKNAGNDDRLFLLLKGYYTAPGSAAQNVSQESWYKVDFYDRGASGQPYENPIDILRNHHYMVNITSVDGPGSETEEEAARSFNTKMEADIKAWNDADPGEIVIEGVYSLSVSEKNITLGRGASAYRQFTVTTDYPLGWNLEVTNSPSSGGNAVDWLSVSPGGESGDAGTTPVTLVLTRHDGDEPRIAYIRVTAGRMTNVVQVTQLPSELLSLSLKPVRDLTFWAYPQESERANLTLEWGPRNMDVQVASEAIGSAGGVSLTPALPASYSGGTATVGILPEFWTGYNADNDLFKTRQTRYTFTLTDSDDNVVTESVVVSQKFADLVHDAKRIPAYPMLSQEETFTVRTNVPEWTATVEEISGKVPSVAGFAVGPGVTASVAGEENTSGRLLTLKMTQGDNNAKYMGKSRIVFRSDYLPQDIVVEIDGRWGFPFGPAGNLRVAHWRDAVNVASGASLLYDPDTGRAELKAQQSSNEAQKYCEDKLREGDIRWYLPTKSGMEEMRLYLGTRFGEIPFDNEDYNNRNPAVRAMLKDRYNFGDGNDGNGRYWTSDRGSLNRPWYVNMMSGGTGDNMYGSSNRYYVRCIRAFGDY